MSLQWAGPGTNYCYVCCYVTPMRTDRQRLIQTDTNSKSLAGGKSSERTAIRRKFRLGLSLQASGEKVGEMDLSQQTRVRFPVALTFILGPSAWSRRVLLLRWGCLLY